MQMETNDIIMSNQEAMYKYEENIDFSLDLTSDLKPEEKQETRPYEEMMTKSMTEIKTLMKERNELTKSKESIINGIKSNKFPTWLQFSTQSYFRVSNADDTDKFNNLWNSLSKEGTETIMRQMVTFLEREIATKEAHMQKCRRDTFESYPDATKGWLDAKKEFDEKLSALKTEHSQELVKYIENLRKVQRPNNDKQEPARGRGGGRGGRRPRRFHGIRGRGKYRPY